MPKWMKLVAGWALAVTIALALSWGAVARVRNTVIQPSAEIPTAAASASSAAPTSQTSTSAPSVIGLEPEVIDSSTSTTVTTAETTLGTTQTTTSQSSPTTTPTTTSSTAPTRTSSYTLAGGVVTISYSPGVVTFVSAIPQPGYSTDRKATGPVEVRIRFESESHTSDFRAEWEGGALKVSQDESGEG